MKEWQPDVVIREPAEFASWAIAERLAIPHVTVNVGMATSAQEWDALVGPWLADLGHRVGVEHLDASSLYRYLVLSFAPAGYQDWSHTPSAMEFRPEPVATTVPLDARILDFDDRPLIYATLGTEFYNADLMRSIISAVMDNDCNLVATTGPQGDPDEIDPHAPSVVVASWIAQDAILDRTAACDLSWWRREHRGSARPGRSPRRHTPRRRPIPARKPRPRTRRRRDTPQRSTVRRPRSAPRSPPCSRHRPMARPPGVARATALLPGIDQAIGAVEHLVATS